MDLGPRRGHRERVLTRELRRTPAVLAAVVEVAAVAAAGRHQMPVVVAVVDPSTRVALLQRGTQGQSLPRVPMIRRRAVRFSS